MPRLILTFLLIATAAPTLASAGQFEPGPCFGQAATIDDHAGEIVGTPGDDVIVGDDGPNLVYGEGGEDRICTNGGDDEVETPCCSDDSNLFVDSGSGNDDIDSSAEGRVELLGGPGNDSLSADGASVGVVRGGAGNDYIYGSWESFGTDGADDLAGDDGDDVIYGYDGDDSLSGGAGTDELYGGPGFDALDGGTSHDTERVRIKRPGKDRFKKVQVEHEDLCQVGPGGGTRANCEREV